MTHRRRRSHGKGKRIAAGNGASVAAGAGDHTDRMDIEVDECRKCWKYRRCPDPERGRKTRCKDYEEDE